MADTLIQYLQRSLVKRGEKLFMSGISRIFKGFVFLRCVPVLFCLLVLNACASTETLYAEYDANCPVELTQAEPGLTMVKDRTTQENMSWHPAVYFALDESVLSASDSEKLEQNLVVLAKYPELRLAVRGFSDITGGNQYNQALASRRVDTVADFLRSNGLADVRLELIALGEELPILKGSEESAHAINRRVELMLLDKQGRPLTSQFSSPDQVINSGARLATEMPGGADISTTSARPATSVAAPQALKIIPQSDKSDGNPSVLPESPRTAVPVKGQY